MSVHLEHSNAIKNALKWSEIPVDMGNTLHYFGSCGK